MNRGRFVSGDARQRRGVAGPARFVHRLLEDLETAIAGRIENNWESTEVLEAIRKCRKQIDAGLQRAQWQKGRLQTRAAADAWRANPPSPKPTT